MSRQHLTIDTIADHLGGLLSEPAAATAERHLSRCVDCSGVRTDLLALREVLAVVPADPMPEAVAVRIEVALATAWEDLDAAHAAVSATRTDLSVTSSDLAVAEARLATADRAARHYVAARPRRWRLASAFAAAGTIGIVFAAVIIGPRLSTSDDDGAGGLAAEPYASSQQEGAESRALDESGDDVPAAGGDPTPGGELAPIRVSQSGRDYTAYTLSQGVGEQLAAAGPGVDSFRDDLIPLAAPGQPLAPFADGGSRVRGCIRALAKQDVEPIVVDLGTYAGEPAVIIVLPDASDPTMAVAWAVDARCGEGEFRIFATVPTRLPTAGLGTTPSDNPTLLGD